MMIPQGTSQVLVGFREMGGEMGVGQGVGGALGGCDGTTDVIRTIHVA